MNQSLTLRLGLSVFKRENKNRLFIFLEGVLKYLMDLI
jgi:hypothetical protein